MSDLTSRRSAHETADGTAGARRLRALTVAAVGAIVGAPYATLALPHSRALAVQAAIVTAATAALAAGGLATRAGRALRPRDVPRAVRVGVAAYAAAALAGAAVGLARGNGLAPLAGQVLSMALLPGAAMAGLLVARAGWWRRFAAAIVGAVAVASCVNLVGWALWSRPGTQSSRMFLANNASPAPAGLIALDLALAVVAWSAGPARWGAGAAFAATAALVAGSAIRSLWLVAAPSVLAVALASRPLRRFATTRRAARAALAVAAAAVALAAASRLWPAGPARALTDRVASEASLLASRLAYLLPGRSEPSPLSDPSLSYRARETVALARELAAAEPAAALLGRGLGYAFVSPDVGLDESGAPAAAHPTNYIHDFYLFLAVKLGLLGGAAALAAVALWITWTVRAARACGSEPERTLLVAAAAAWVAGAVWNVVCPEFIDFRMAPLWGLLLAASVDAARRPD